MVAQTVVSLEIHLAVPKVSPLAIQKAGWMEHGWAAMWAWQLAVQMVD